MGGGLERLTELGCRAQIPRQPEPHWPSVNSPPRTLAPQPFTALKLARRLCASRARVKAAGYSRLQRN
jgi:hypothetical protein